MANPNDVKPRLWKNVEVIYDNNNFSICIGEYGDLPGDKHIGMRFNTTDKSEAGYPRLFKNPQWFAMPEEFTVPMLNVLAILLMNNEDIPTVVKESSLPLLGKNILKSLNDFTDTVETK